MNRARLFLVMLFFTMLAACSGIPRTTTPLVNPTAASLQSPTSTLTFLPQIPTPTVAKPEPLVLQKGPYLLFTEKPDEMRVLWQSAAREDFHFAWGTNATYSNGEILPQVDIDSFIYNVTVSGLAPGTRYFYRIFIHSAEVTGSFISSPDASSTHLVFWAFGDTRSGPETHNMIAANILQQVDMQPSEQTLVISTGDLMDTASEQSLEENEFSASQTQMRDLLASMPVVNVMGNHDGTALFKKYFPYPYTTANDWSFDYGPTHFLVINQYLPLEKGSSRWEWMKNDLSSSNRTWKVTLLHEPGWSAGPHENNETVQQVIHPLAVAYGVQLILAGHNHYYARAEVDGVFHITTGGGGAQLYDPETGWPLVQKTEKAYHYLKIEINGNIMTIQAYSPMGELLDEFTINAR